MLKKTNEIPITLSCACTYVFKHLFNCQVLTHKNEYAENEFC